MMYHSSEVRKVHLEITTKCSARCPQCMRTYMGDTHPDLPQVELSLADIEHIFPPSLVRQLQELHICGNYGDATAAQDTVEVMRYFRTTNPKLILQIMTHGSARSVDWWRDLALLGVRCNFGIDGLEDTNHIYRRGTNWKMIMRNTSAFIDVGGRAIWNFIVFAHNEHQVERARTLSQEMKFEKFIVKKTARFLHKHNQEQDIYERDGTVVGKLRAPQNPEFRNELTASFKNDQGRTDKRHMHDYYATTPIFCKAANQLGIFVSAEALVTPCCYLSLVYPGGPKASQLLERIGGPSAINAREHSVADIIDGPVFQDIVPNGWDVGPDRIHMCARMCGTYDHNGMQTEDRKRRSIELRATA